MTENNQLKAPQDTKKPQVIEKDNRICRFCGEIKTSSHHCSGKKAFEFGRTIGRQEVEKEHNENFRLIKEKEKNGK